jgi:hypothetical protein
MLNGCRRRWFRVRINGNGRGRPGARTERWEYMCFNDMVNVRSSNAHDRQVLCACSLEI